MKTDGKSNRNMKEFSDKHSKVESDIPLVKSVSDYLNRVNGCISYLGLDNTTTTPYFRGQAKSSYKLIPSIFRHDNLVLYERDVNRDFKLLCRTLIKEHFPSNELEWIYLMQHYGLPTRLLDWSESSLVALFFAVEDTANVENASVWALSPRVYNHCVLEVINTVPVDHSPFLRDYILKADEKDKIFRKVDAIYPIAIRPSKNSPRILAQRGVFTIHGSQAVCISDHASGLENLYGDKIICKIEIDGAYKQTILKELYQSGISHSVLFPELSGVSRELLNRYTKFYKA